MRAAVAAEAQGEEACREKGQARKEIVNQSIYAAGTTPAAKERI